MLSYDEAMLLARQRKAVYDRESMGQLEYVTAQPANEPPPVIEGQTITLFQPSPAQINSMRWEVR